jgi:hypothetical protein
LLPDLDIWRGAFTAPWDWRRGERAPVVTEQAEPPQPAAACCKVSTNSKACGNSRISKKKSFHKAPARACDAQ